MLKNKVALSILFILVLVTILNFLPVQAQGSIDELIITDIDTAGFPQVNLQFRALDILNRPVPGVVRDTFTVTEDGSQMPIDSVTETEEGVWIHFVIDAGAGMTDERWDRAEEGLLNFLNDTPWMRDGLDHVAISVVDWAGLRPLTDFTSDSDSLIGVVEGFSPPGGASFSDPLPEISNILDEFDLLEGAEGQAKFVYLISSGLERGGEDRVSQLVRKSQELEIPVYTTLVRSDQRIPCPAPFVDESGNTIVPGCDENLRDVGEQTGGQYVHFQNSNSLNDGFREITDHRLQYNLSYRSNIGNSGTRQVELIANAGENANQTDIVSYDIEVNPPRVLIESPRDGQLITRKAAEYIEDRGAIPPTTQSVAANVLFPDNPRRMLRATLFVDGAVKDEINNPQQDVEFSWNLRDITELGITDHALIVEVEDELGLISQSPSTTARVEVFVPPQPTPEVQIETIIATVLPPTPTPIPCLLPDSLCDPVERPVRQNPLAVTSLIVALASLTFAGVVWFNRDKAPVRAAIEGVTSAVTRITKRIQRSEPRGYLEVIAGDVNIGKVLEIYGDTPIGRSRQNAELLFQQDDENSPLSRWHCTIIDEEDHFMIKDEDSANGTYLNGVRLQPLVAEELVDGDEIELARVERGGVRLQFRIAQVDETGLDGDLRETRRTRKSSDNNDDDLRTHGDRF